MTNSTAIMTLADTERLGSIFVKSGFFADAKQEAQAIVKILAGRELGLSEIVSMTGIHIVAGKISLSANIVGALIKRGGRYDFRVREISDQVCRIEFFEIVDGKPESLGISVFTLEDAKRAGTQNMQKFPRNMLHARALTNGARWYMPDVYAGGIYTPEELGAIVNGDGDVIDVVPTQIPMTQYEYALEQLLNEHDAEAILAANGGNMPATLEEVERLALMLNRAATGEDKDMFDLKNGRD
jgi:hypothetical protein